MVPSIEADRGRVLSDVILSSQMFNRVKFHSQDSGQPSSDSSSDIDGPRHHHIALDWKAAQWLQTDRSAVY
eukprot:scaffold57045_cov52-Attheya_sp.AAC.2